MNKKFPMINVRGLIYLAVIGLVLLVCADYVLIKIFSGASRLMILPAFILVALLFVVLMLVRSVLSVKIEVKDGTVWLPVPMVPRVNEPAFELAELETIHLEKADGTIVPNDSKNYSGCKIVFTTKSGEIHEFFPLALERRHYKRMYDSLNSMK